MGAMNAASRLGSESGSMDVGLYATFRSRTERPDTEHFWLWFTPKSTSMLRPPSKQTSSITLIGSLYHFFLLTISETTTIVRATRIQVVQPSVNGSLLKGWTIVH